MGTCNVKSSRTGKIRQRARAAHTLCEEGPDVVPRNIWSSNTTKNNLPNDGLGVAAEHIYVMAPPKQKTKC